MKNLAASVTIAFLTFGPALGRNALAADATQTEPGKPAVAPVYTVDVYDPKRNPEDDLKMTVQRAEAEGKRILIQVGGDWCGWCKLMTQYFHENKKVAGALAQNFLIMKVNFSQGHENKEFLKKFPPAEGYPHLYVLESNGKLVHSQPTGVLEEGKGYSEKAMLEFLARWASKRSG
jgi:thiol:disulfide interchange protein